jgi:MFS family permease
LETLRFNEYGELRKEILLVILVNSIFGFAVGFAVPSVAPLIVFMNVTMTFVGNIRSATQTIGSLIRPLLGPLVDRYGPKTFYLLGGMITTIGHVFYALTESWILLAAGLLLTNLDIPTRGLSSTVAIGKGSDTKTRGKAFSLDLGINQLASTFAPLIGGYAADELRLSFRWIFGIAGGLMLLGLVLMAVKYSPPVVSKTIWHPSLGGFMRQAFSIDRRLRTYALVSTLDWFFWGLSFPFYSLFIYKQLGVTTEQLGIVAAIASASPTIASLALGPVLDRWRTTRFLAVSEFMAIGALTPILVGTGVEFAYVSSVFWGLVYGLWVPAMNSFILDTVGNESFARASGNVSLLANILSIPSPAIAGWLFDNISPKAPFAITLIGAITTGTLILLLLKEPRTAATQRT